MSRVKVLSKTPLSLAEVADTLKALDKKSEIQSKTLKFAKKFSKLSLAKTKELIDELVSLQVPMLDLSIIKKIADILPRDSGELASVLASTKTAVSKENFKKIEQVLEKYRKK